MSHDDSLDEETKRLLAQVEPDDSKESNKPKKKQDTLDWETNTVEDPDSEW